MEIPVIMAIFIAISIIIAVAAWFFLARCPKCKRYFALHRTGKQHKEGGWFAETYEEWLCQHCEHREWKIIIKMSGGGF